MFEMWTNALDLVELFNYYLMINVHFKNNTKIEQIIQFLLKFGFKM